MKYKVPVSVARTKIISLEELQWIKKLEEIEYALTDADFDEIYSDEDEDDRA